MLNFIELFEKKEKEVETKIINLREKILDVNKEYLELHTITNIDLLCTELETAIKNICIAEYEYGSASNYLMYMKLGGGEKIKELGKEIENLISLIKTEGKR